MNPPLFQKEVAAAVGVLRNGGIILYPTDTVWGIGCDATNEEAINHIFKIKQRDDSKSLIILVGDERDILHYTAAPDLRIFDFLQQQTRPTTIVLDGAIGLPQNLIAADGSVAIRIVQDEFCRHLIKCLRKPLVSTSANISGQSSPQNFLQISDVIKQGVNYIVQWRQDDTSSAQPSQIIRWNRDGSTTIIRP